MRRCPLMSDAIPLQHRHTRAMSGERASGRQSHHSAAHHNHRPLCHTYPPAILDNATSNKEPEGSAHSIQPEPDIIWLLVIAWDDHHLHWRRTRAVLPACVALAPDMCMPADDRPHFLILKHTPAKR